MADKQIYIRRDTEIYRHSTQQRERQRDRETERQRERQRERGRQAGRHRDTDTHTKRRLPSLS